MFIVMSLLVLNCLLWGFTLPFRGSIEAANMPGDESVISGMPLIFAISFLI